MAYASLVSLERTTDLILNHHKYSISAYEREQITSICKNVDLLILFLENTPEKANRLEGKIRDLANEAEDLIEVFMWTQIKMDLGVGLSSFEFGGYLNKVREQICSISGDVMDDRLCDLPAAISSSRVAASGKKDVVIGLDEDLLAIKDRLCGQSSKLEVIPIVGMGGIGKSTLAQNAYDDSLIMDYFDIRAFVQVSQDFSAQEFLSKLLASIKLFERQTLGEMNECEVAENVCNESGIAEKVYKGLKGRRYVIVMDDIWSTDDWDKIRYIFPDDGNGSRIMLTTRLSDVATYASCGSSLHEMNFMDVNQSWDLLKQKVFTNGQDCPPELEEMGKEIAGGCRGLPLAVVLVAGVLSTVVKTQDSWKKIAKNVNSVVDGQLDKILSLSYTHLPHHLRPCFLFMAAFPEDYNLRAWRLINLWIAEGFLRHQDGDKSLEEEAEEFLEDLVKRSLVLVTSRKSNGRIKSCRLHDLVRDMCIRKAQEEKFLLSCRNVHSNGIESERRISIGHLCLDKIQCPTIRTILCFPAFLNTSSLLGIVSFRLLRVLEVINYVHDDVLLPPEVFELFHLRYLALACRNEIPAAISNLVNLQTLIIGSKILLRRLAPLYSSWPVEIWRMPYLRHLVFKSFCHMLPDPLDGSTLPLDNLQTLWGIASFVCSERILKMIPNLKKLGIIYSIYNEDRDHLLQNLASLHQLEKLKITVPWHFSSWQKHYPAFPLALKILTLVGGRIRWKDMSIVGSLPNLQVLKLKNYACYGEIWKTTDGEFPQLEFLLIDGSYLQQWITERPHFPRLKCLTLHNCQYLTEIPESIGEILTLELIEVDSRNEFLVKSAKQIQEDQLSYGNDALQVHCKTVRLLVGYYAPLFRSRAKYRMELRVKRSQLRKKSSS